MIYKPNSLEIRSWGKLMWKIKFPIYRIYALFHSRLANNLEDESVGSDVIIMQKQTSECMTGCPFSDIFLF